MQATNTASKASILALYRRCMRSIQKMPDAGQRATYLIYVRDGFRRNAQLPSNSREAINAYRGGLEQVEQMEYYQSMKKRQSEEKQNIGAETSLQNTRRERTGVSTGNKVGNCLSSTSDTANMDIANWLLRHLPHLNEDDVKKYTQQLVGDGFDSVTFLEEELLAEDISFMKKAHRRVIERQLKSRRGGDDV